MDLLGQQGLELQDLQAYKELSVQLGLLAQLAQLGQQGLLALLVQRALQELQGCKGLLGLQGQLESQGQLGHYQLGPKI